MVRIDMSEFMEQHSVARLIGAPPGYVGYEEGGRLTEAVRRRPYSVVLFDEIEKAHRDVFNVLLQVLDDGRLTDGQGRTVDFKNTLIVMTSNIASEYILALTEQQAEQWEIEAKLTEALRSQFRPEFLNRVDEVIVFHSLTKDDLRGVVEIQLRQLQFRLQERNVQLTITDPAKDLLGEMGYDASFGARPLKRLIQQKLENKLAEMILSGKVPDGAAVRIDGHGKSFVFEVSGGTESASGTAEQAETLEGEGME
jgi:ATP-dependent Clp protease ATP-binding subunit ClpB